MERSAIVCRVGIVRCTVALVTFTSKPLETVFLRQKSLASLEPVQLAKPLCCCASQHSADGMLPLAHLAHVHELIDDVLSLSL
jgi:hypothetical protein